MRGLGAVKFNIARVLADNVNHLITQTSGILVTLIFEYQFQRDNISEIATQIQPFDATDHGKEQYTALDLSKYLSTKTNSGGPLDYFYCKHKDGCCEKTTLDVTTRRLVLITNLGLIVKNNVDSTHDVFVQSITQGTPVSNASVPF